MEPSIVIIGLIVIAVLALVFVLRSRRKRDASLSQDIKYSSDPPVKRPTPTQQPRPGAAPQPSQPQAPLQGGGGVSRGGGSMTGPNPASGGLYPPPPLDPEEQNKWEPQAAKPPQPAGPVAPIKPLPPQPQPPIQQQQTQQQQIPPPIEANPSEQWQAAEPPSPPPADDYEYDEDLLLDDLTPPPAAEEPEPAPAPPVTRAREEEFEEAPPPPIPPQPEPIPASIGGDEPLGGLITNEEAKQAEPPKPPAPKSEVNFTAFYPRTAQATRRYGLYIYAHLPTALATIQTDAQKFTQELGGSVPAPRTTKQPTQIAEGQPITITPECDGLTFDPPTLTKRWDAPYVRYEFDFKPAADQVGDELQGRAQITVAGIEVAQLKFTIEVVALDEPTIPAPNANALTGDAQPPTLNRPMSGTSNANSLVPPPNPLAVAKQLAQSDSTKMYTKIFVSYSRKDKPVAEAYRLAQLALGNEVFMDTYSIRTGEDWRVALATAIDSADIFQLFWSENSAASPNVRDEWDYALHYRCSDTRCIEFIRPVFWKAPIPVPPPTELSHLNFRYVPLANE